MNSENKAPRPHILVLGAGFAGLTFCQKFPSGLANITLVDRQNHHLFQPLLYQVATAGLSAPDIAQPIRSILAKHEDVTVLMAEVHGIDLKGKRVRTDHGEISYDYLVLALGGVTSYFGHDEWAEFAPGLKTLNDALAIRRRVLLSFERAETETDETKRKELLTTIVVGGGPTGVELAGAIAELARKVLRKDFTHIDPARAHVILVEGADRILLQFPSNLAERGKKQLERLGVDVRTNRKVKTLRENEIEFVDGQVLRAGNIFWGAGVGAIPLTKTLGVDVDRAGRIKVAPDCSIPGFREAFALGDLAALTDANGKVVPGVSPAAMQMAKHVAKIIEGAIRDKAEAQNRPPFKYWDKGSMATIGRSSAVAMIGKLQFSGALAWLAWLAVHLIFLVGFRNRVAVFAQWVYSYFTYKRGARIITGPVRYERPAVEPSHP
jgi:NADH dehydrogenase